MTTIIERPAPLTRPTARSAPAASTAPSATGRGIPAWAVELIVVTLLAVLVALVHGHALSGGPAPGDDEGTYVAQAYAINHFGSLAPYTYWYDHPPLGWILIAVWNATFGHLTHSIDAVAAGRAFLVMIATASGVLIYAVARRMQLRRWAAIAAVLGWTLSPLALSYSRMVYLDNIAVPLLLGSLALALTPRRHLWAYAGSGLLLALAILTKETLLLAAPAVSYAIWRGSRGRTRTFCLAAFTSTAVLVLAFYPLLAVLRGELLPGLNHVSLWDALRFQLFTRPSSGSPLSPHSAAATLVGQWLHTDPWLLGGGVLLAPIALALPRLRPAALALLLPVLLALRPGYLPDPFVIALLPFCALILAGVVDTAIAAIALRLGRAAWRSAHGCPQLIGPRLVTAEGGRWHSLAWQQRARPALIASLLVAMAAGITSVAIAPRWHTGDRAIYDDKSQQSLVAAENWIGGNVPHTSRIVVDDTLWVDLVNRGFNPHLGVIWFYKTDFTNNLDPSVARALPNGYRDFQYVVSTPVIRSALRQLPSGLSEVRSALRYSAVVATFGTGANRIEIRKLAVPPDAPLLPSPLKP